MSRAIRYLFLFCILFFVEGIQAQRLGLLPSNTKWFQLRHDSLRIIYPEGEEATARRAASLMLKFAAADPIDKQSRYQPISILLQPRTNISNGYVGLAPYVSEFYTQPNENPFELGSLPWTDLLAIHEYRHVQQVNAVNTGISHLVKVIFGDLAFSAMYGLATANWLREGDAVYAETKWTPQGRGRLSRFMLPFRENSKEKEPWNYYKLRSGSYREFLPDHYSLGYMMVLHGNLSFGEETWDTIFREAPRMKPIYDPFSGTVKRYYGKSNKNLYLDAIKSFGDQWKSEEVADIHYTAVPLSEKNLKEPFFDMNFPNVSEEGNIYCSITTYDSISAIYKIEPDGKREKIVSLGLQSDLYFDYSNKKLVWTEIRLDPRWIRMDKNVIVLYDEVHGKKMDIKPSKGYFMPSLDISGKKIVALHADLEGQYHLRILDAGTGDVVQELPNDNNLYLGYPSFSSDGDNLIATARNNQGRMCLVKQNILSGTITQITHYSYVIIGRPIEVGPWILTTCSIDDIDQVYAVDKEEGIFYQVSGGNKAHYDPSWDPVKEEVIATQYSNNGKKLVRIPGNTRLWQMTNLDDGIKYVAGAEERNLLEEPMAENDFEIKKFSPWSNAINLHSWIVTANDPVWGVELRSDNIMSNVTIAAGYEFNINNKVNGPYFDMRLGMWFPEVDLGYSKLSKKFTAADGSEFRSVLEEGYAGLTLPFTFTPGVYNQIVNLSTSFHLGVNYLNPDQEVSENLHYNYLQHRLLLINSRRKAYKQPLPSWGQRFDISYANNVTEVTIAQLYGSLELAFPSFQPSNYIIVIGESLTQNLNPGSIQLNSGYAGPRGFAIVDDERNYRLGLTYGFPLLYPDIGFGNVAYVRRIRLQPFFDIAYTSSPSAISSTLKSTGAELLIDFFANITLGLRLSRLLSGYEGDPFKFEFFIPPQRF